MNLLIEKETDDSFEFDYEKAAKSIIEQALDYLKCPYEDYCMPTYNPNP